MVDGPNRIHPRRACSADGLLQTLPISPRSRRAYGNVLRRLAAFLHLSTADDAIQALLDLRSREADRVAQAFLNAVAEKQSARTVRLMAAAIRSVAKEARDRQISKWHPDLNAPRDPRPSQVTVRKRSTFASVSEGLDAGTARGARAIAILSLITQHGLRRGEIVGLDLIDLDLVSLALDVRTSRSPRTITLSNTASLALSAWLAHRGNLRGPLFTGIDRPGQPQPNRIDPKQLWAIAYRQGARVGLQLSPRILRHQAIARVARKTRGDCRKIKSFGGVTKLQNIDRYL